MTPSPSEAETVPPTPEGRHFFRGILRDTGAERPSLPEMHASVAVPRSLECSTA